MIFGIFAVFKKRDNTEYRAMPLEVAGIEHARQGTVYLLTNGTRIEVLGTHQEADDKLSEAYARMTGRGANT